MSFALVLDIIVALLLAATIAYAVVLNRKLGQLRRNRDEMMKLIASFNEAMSRADAGVQRLRKAAGETGRTLQEQVEKAQALRDDLAYMVDRGDSIANRLEEGVRTWRQSEANQTHSVIAQAVSAAEEAQPAHGGGQDGRAGRERPPAREEARSGGTTGQGGGGRAHPGRGASLADRLRPEREAEGESAYDTDESGERSATERELLRALQSSGR